MSENTESMFVCGDCDYSTAEFKEGVGHASTYGHELTRTIDDEGTTMTISVVYEDEDEWGDDEDADWNAADQ